MLAVYVRKNVIDVQTAISMQSQAERQLADNEYTANSMDVLTLAAETGCSAYDFEFVSLAIRNWSRHSLGQRSPPGIT